MRRAGRLRRVEETDELRRRYLEVVKMALLDLGGTTTGRIDNRGRVTEVAVDDPRRMAGADWPARALTMIGRIRLDHLQELVTSVVQRKVAGDLIEAGVWRGGASLLMKAVLVAYGDRDRHVVLADSFRGVPRPKNPRGDAGDDLYRFSGYLGVPRREVEGYFERYGLLDERVEFVEGLFDKTMPGLANRQWSLLRLDGDLYESLMPPLEHLYERLSPGGFVVVDDYVTIPQAQHAVEEFRARLGIDAPLRVVGQNVGFWQKPGS